MNAPMIGSEVARYCLLKADEFAADIRNEGDLAQKLAETAERSGKFARASVDAILAPYGVTLAQLERAELPQ